jgi:hypothetical protein
MWVKQPGRDVDYQIESSVEVKERVELYLYSPSGPLWPVLEQTLPISGLLDPATFRVPVSNISFGYFIPKTPSQFRGTVKHF